MDNWIIVTEDGPIAGLVAAVRGLGGTVRATVVGSRALAELVSSHGPDAVVWFPCGPETPPESFADAVAEQVAGAAPGVVLSLGDPASRVLLTVTAIKVKAAILDSVPRLELVGDTLVITRPAVAGRVVETLQVAGPLAGFFDGEDVTVSGSSPAPITEATGIDPSPAVRVIAETVTANETAGLQHARRVVGVGRGIRTRGDLAQVDDLAAALDAEIACTLPLCDDMRWYDETHVVGTSTQQIAPDLYVGLGLSGQPQHMSGVRAAKVVVGINNDPEATIFKKCHYGVVGDLYEIVPALTAALKGA